MCETALPQNSEFDSRFEANVSAPKVGLLVRTTWAAARTLRYARIVDLAANYSVAIALLETLHALLTARRGLWAGGRSQQHYHG
jgi:hypothetical protein